MVGSHLIYDLTRSGKKVRALSHRPESKQRVQRLFSHYHNNPEELLSLIEWVECDLLDIYSLLDALEDVEEVYHCAALVSFHKKDRALMQQVNTEGTANLVNAALERNIRKFCHVSSIATLGRKEEQDWINEEAFWKSSPKNSAYAVSKYGAEREVWRAAEEGLPVVIVNPSLVIGPGNWDQSTCAMFAKAYAGIRFYTEGENGFVDVRDVTKLMIRLMDSDITQQRFILNGENAPFRRFFDVMHEALGQKKPSIKAGPVLSKLAWMLDSIRSSLSGTGPLITRESARSAHRVSRFSNAKILNAFPDHSFISMEQSVLDTCKIFLKEKGNRG